MILKVGIAGASGRIGQRLIDMIDKDPSLSISCGLVSEKSMHGDVIHEKFSDQCHHSDIWIDFSTPQAFEKVLTHCVETQTPLVTGTTGLSKKHFVEIEHAAQDIPILWASNFAISINLIQHLLSNYSKLYTSEVAISETHHIHKKDMPSGTAITLARSIKPHGIVKKIDDNDYQLDGIEISCKREGEVTGIHTVDLDNDAEKFSIIHESKTPDIYAQGAINVAKWLYKQNTGLHTMGGYIESLS